MMNDDQFITYLLELIAIIRNDMDMNIVGLISYHIIYVKYKICLSTSIEVQHTKIARDAHGVSVADVIMCVYDYLFSEMISCSISSWYCCSGVTTEHSYWFRT